MFFGLFLKTLVFSMFFVPFYQNFGFSNFFLVFPTAALTSFAGRGSRLGAPQKKKRARATARKHQGLR